MTTPTPAGRARQARIMRLANVPMRRILGLPLWTPLGGRLMLLYYTGRRTGRSYRQPVSYVRDGDVLLTPGGGRWTENLVSGTAIRARIAGKDHELSPELVRDPSEVGALLARMAARNPALARFVPLPRDEDGTFEQGPLRDAIDHGFRIVRWHSA